MFGVKIWYQTEIQDTNAQNSRFSTEKPLLTLTRPRPRHCGRKSIFKAYFYPYISSAFKIFKNKIHLFKNLTPHNFD